MNKIDPTSAVIGGLAAGLITLILCVIGWIGVQVIGGSITSLGARIDGIVKECNPKFADHDKQLKELHEWKKKCDEALR